MANRSHLPNASVGHPSREPIVSPGTRAPAVNLSANGDKPRYAGVVAAMITPCRSAGEVDTDGAARLARIITANGCDGVFVVSSTGESIMLDEHDRRSLIGAARLGCPSEKLLYAGVSGMGPKDIARQAHAAAVEGADVAVVMAPFFVRISQTELRDFVLSLADVSPIPVCFYHHRRMPTPFEIDTIVVLAEHPNVVAMKETSEDLQRVSSIVNATAHTKLALLHGNERLILHTLREGGHGCVSALATVAPEWHRQLLDAWDRRDEARAQRMEQSIIALWQMFALEQTRMSFSHFVYSLKYTAHLRGWLENTDTMVPGFSPSAAFQKLIENHVRMVGLLDLAK